MSSNLVQGVLAGARRPARVSTFGAVLTLAWRAMLKIKHVPFQLFDVLVFPIMMTFMFTYLFGGALAGSPREYVQWLTPGIVVQTMVCPHHLHRRGAVHGHPEGPVRPLQVAAHLATRARGRRAARRSFALRAGGHRG